MIQALIRIDTRNRGLSPSLSNRLIKTFSIKYSLLNISLFFLICSPHDVVELWRVDYGEVNGGMKFAFW
jgi:hypothetical protein